MKVYLLIRNEYAMHEFDEDTVISVYLDRKKAYENCNLLNDNQVNASAYSSVVFRVESYEVTV